METTPDQPTRMPGDPYCGACGYNLRGATESSKCPECGRPIVEVLTRERLGTGTKVKRYRSDAMVFGLPFIDVAFGARPEFDEPMGQAKGFIALGDSAVGFIAVGGRSFGVVSVGGISVGVVSTGGCSVGLLSAMGGASLGGLATGGGAIGGLASGGGAIGVVAQGGGAVGIYASGGGAAGVHVYSPIRRDPEAVEMFRSTTWYFGGSKATPMSKNAAQAMLTPMAVHFGIGVLLTLLLLIIGRALQRSAPSAS